MSNVIISNLMRVLPVSFVTCQSETCIIFHPPCTASADLDRFDPLDAFRFANRSYAILRGELAFERPQSYPPSGPRKLALNIPGGALMLPNPKSAN
jgi:hypothetical protein